MKQSSLTLEGRTLPVFEIQTIIVGSGAAGLNAAVSLYKNGQKDIAVLTEGKRMGTSLNTGSDKQTYYKLTTAGPEADSVRKMAQVLFSGQSMDGDLALCEAAYSPRAFFHLVDIGVPFPCNGFGEYVGYKTDHDPNQRGTSAGPLTSKFMTEALWKEAERYHIPVFDGYQVIEILTEEIRQPSEKRVRGVVALNTREMDPEKQFTVFSADNVIYAVGGEAGMYETSVYPVSQTGGLGTAFRAGARGKNLTESQYGIASVKFRWNLSGTYQQVLPRYYSTAQDLTDEREFLEDSFETPEQLLQAIFLKGYQWPFDPRKTLAYGSSLIDILVYQETVLRGRRVFLDYRRNPGSAGPEGSFDKKRLSEEARQYLESSDGLYDTPIERLAHMNPAAIELYRSHGIDLYKESLEIAVCAQHNNGGLAGNCWWESNLKHLFPVGEDNGTHGVYRPGGSALNSGQVGGLRAAEFIARRYTGKALPAERLAECCGAQLLEAVRLGLDALSPERSAMDYKKEKQELGRRMSGFGANIRSEEGTEKALKENRAQQERLRELGAGHWNDLKHYYRLRDLLVSQEVYLSAILDYIRKGGPSRGSYLIFRAAGDKPLEKLPEIFRFSLADNGFGERIQEICYTPDGCETFWRPVRPIPPEDSWFEKVWRDYREGRYWEVQ